MSSLTSHQTVEEAVLRDIDALYRNWNFEDQMLYVQADSMMDRLAQFIKDRTVGEKDKGNMYLVKTYLHEGNRSKLEKRLFLGDLYRLIDDLNWIEIHPKKDYGLLEIKTMVNKAKGIEKVDIMERLKKLNEDENMEYNEWHRIDED